MVFAQTRLDVSAAIAPGPAVFNQAGAQANGGVVQSIGQCLRIEHVHGHMAGEFFPTARSYFAAHRFQQFAAPYQLQTRVGPWKMPAAGKH